VTWAEVLLLGVIGYAVRAGGFLIGDRILSVDLDEITDAIFAALLAGLIITQTFGDGRGFVLDARAAGLLAAGVAALLRWPVIVVMLVGTAVPALLRLLG
jgi:branched-subunit amino acid transport protein